MTEKDKIILARKYVDYLSHGFNPLDESPVGKDDIVRNERISRCLMFVSDILGKVIENEEAPQVKAANKRSGKKEAFFLDEAERRRFIFSDTPVTVSDIAKGLSALRDESRYTVLSGAAISEWLTITGFLIEKITDDGKSRYFVTDEGEKLGIFSEKRISKNNMPYFVNLYMRSAQEFIVDNLDAVIEHNQARRIIQKANRQERKTLKKFGYTDINDEVIRDLYSAGATVDDIVFTTDYDRDFVIGRMKALGLI